MLRLGYVSVASTGLSPMVRGLWVLTAVPPLRAPLSASKLLENLLIIIYFCSIYAKELIITHSLQLYS